MPGALSPTCTCGDKGFGGAAVGGPEPEMYSQGSGGKRHEGHGGFAEPELSTQRLEVAQAHLPHPPRKCAAANSEADIARGDRAESGEVDTPPATPHARTSGPPSI